MYVGAIAYLAAPLFNWHLDSASVADAFHSLSVYSQVAIKSAVAFPFTYHSWNGIRHLIWDTQKELSLTGGMFDADSSGVDSQNI